MACPQRADRAREGERLTERVESQAPGPDIWGIEGYEVFSELFAPIYDELVDRLRAVPGERWLDVATGSGEVAICAARAGASVTGIDLSRGMLERAERKGAGLGIRWDLGDAQDLPYEEGSFDVVSSNFGVIFAPDNAVAARELARVSRRGGRLGLTTWRPNPGLEEVYARFGRERSPVQFDAWGDEAEAEALLGQDFELTIDERVWYLEGETAEAVFEMMAVAAPPTKAFLDELDAATRAELRRALIEYWDRFRENGRVREPRPYLLILGTRR